MKKLIILIITATMLSSCIVTKKKYDAAVARGKYSLDSLNRVFNTTVTQFNANTERLQSLSNKKSSSYDSLTTVNKQISGDKDALSQSLNTAINDYNREKQNLIAKSRTVDSLKNILELQNHNRDSIESLNDANISALNNLLTSINSAIKGTNQSECYAQRSGGKILITIWDSYLFQSGTTISSKGQTLLKKISAVLSLNENLKVEVVGNTDNTGTAKTNLEFSVRKAAAVVSFLTENSTTSSKNYTASGRGFYNPIASNDTPANKAKNKRVEILLTN